MQKATIWALLLITNYSLALAEHPVFTHCSAQGELSDPACACVADCAQKGEQCQTEATKAKKPEGISSARCGSITELCQSRCKVVAEKEYKVTRNDVLAAVAAQALHFKEMGKFVSCKDLECTKILKNLEFKGKTKLVLEAVDDGTALVGKAHSSAGTDLRFTYDSRRGHPKLRQHHEGQEDAETEPKRNHAPSS